MGGRVTVFGGSIEAEVVGLEPGRRIEQRWRRTEWEDGCWSRLVIQMEEPQRGNTVGEGRQQQPNSSSSAAIFLCRGEFGSRAERAGTGGDRCMATRPLCGPRSQCA